MAVVLTWETLKVNDLYEIARSEDEDYKKNCPIRMKGKKRVFYGSKNPVNGYVQIKLIVKDQKKKKGFLKHQIMMSQWGRPNTENKPCIDHINGKRTDNRLENLRWATYEENQANRHYVERVEIVLNEATTQTPPITPPPTIETATQTERAQITISEEEPKFD